MHPIDSLRAWEILDSRGRPTLKARCVLRDGSTGEASVPSGASTGAAEAMELRDKDPSRFGGWGCRLAADQVAEILLPELQKQHCATQSQVDDTLARLLSQSGPSSIGANATLAASLAYARASAAANQMPLCKSLAGLLDRPLTHLPRPTINLFSGGKHAGGQVAIQDVLVVPLSATTVEEALSMTFNIYQKAAVLAQHRYGTRALVADEGGLAPPFACAEDMLKEATEAITKAGYAPGKDIGLAVDVASSHFFHEGTYQLDGKTLGSAAMIDLLEAWRAKHGLISIEDGLAEDDWDHWPDLLARLGDHCLILGDDLLCTNPARIQRAVDARAANALLLKVNQIGTLSQAAHSLCLARASGWHITVSARSGETEDNWLADLAVGWGGDHLKIGSITRSERLAKYNRLWEIERETGLRFKPIGK